MNTELKEGYDVNEYEKFKEDERYEQYYGDLFYRKFEFFDLKEDANLYKVANTNGTNSFVVNSVVRDALMEIVLPIVGKHVKNIDIESVNDFVRFWEMKFIDMIIDDKDKVPIYDYMPNK